MKKKLPIVRSLLFVSTLLTPFALTSCGKPSDAIVAIALHPTNASIVYIATNESVYKTRDRGTTWERMATDLSSYRVLSRLGSSTPCHGLCRNHVRCGL